MSGFILAQREVVEHPLFSKDSSRLGAWMWLLFRARWRETPFDVGGRMITLERGQLCVSRTQLSDAWGWKPSAVERFLARLEDEHMIERTTGQGRTIITICNYSKYQDASELPGQANGRTATRTGGRSKTGQVTGQADMFASDGKTTEKEPENFAPGQATGQASDSQRTAKEQRNKGTRVSNDTHIPPKAPRPKKTFAHVDRPEDVDPEVWQDFLVVRETHKSPAAVTPTALKGLRREAGKAGLSLTDALARCVEKGWRGFEAAWISGSRGNGYAQQPPRPTGYAAGLRAVARYENGDDPFG